MNYNKSKVYVHDDKRNIKYRIGNLVIFMKNEVLYIDKTSLTSEEMPLIMSIYKEL